MMRAAIWFTPPPVAPSPTLLPLMPLIRRFLIVDDNADARSLLTRTLLRKFPQSLATECGDATTAILSAQNERLDAVIVHRAGDTPGLELIQLLRKAAPGLLVIYVSGIDRTAEARAAGADAFLNYDAWLGLGTLVAQLLQQRTAEEPASAPSKPLAFKPDAASA